MTRRAAAVLATFLALIYGASAARAQDAGAAPHVGRGDSAAVGGLSAAPAYRNPGLAAGLSPAGIVPSAGGGMAIAALHF